MKSKLAVAISFLAIGGISAAYGVVDERVYAEDAEVASPLVLDTDVLINAYLGVTVTYSGGISGAGKLMKTGEGTLVLSGANTFTGDLEALEGQIQLSSPLSPSAGTGTVVLGGGRVVCKVANALDSSKIKWTDAAGTLDVNGYATTVLLDGDSTPVLEKGTIGYEVINSTASKPTVTVLTIAEGTDVYVRFSGNMTLTPSTKNIRLKNRRHDITGFSIGADRMYIDEGTVIRGVTAFTANSGSRTLCVTSEEPDCFSDLKSITIGKSRLQLNSQTILSEFSRRGDMQLVVSSGNASNAGLVLPTADSWFIVKSLTAGSGATVSPGRYQASDYYGLSSGAYSRGYLVVEGDRNTAASESIVWSGGTAADLATPSNWTGAEPTDLSNPANCYSAQITSGSSATLSEMAFFSGFQFGGGLSGFSVGTAGDTECLRIDGDGITFGEKVNPSAARTFEFFCPVVLNSSATLTIPENDRLVFHNGASINADGVKLDGAGTLVFAGGTNYVEGAITFTNGTIAASGAVKGGGSVAVLSDSRRTIWLNGADFAVPVTNASASVQNLNIDTESDASVTNVIRGITAGATFTLYLRENRVFVIDGLHADGKITFAAISGSNSDGATVIFRNVSQSSRSDGYFASQHSTRLVLDSSDIGDGRRLMMNKAGGRIEFIRDDWYSAATAAKATAGAFHSDNGRFELNATHQYCSYIDGAAPIDGDAGSAIEIGRGTGTTYAGAIGGAASLVMNGSGTQTLSAASTTTGDIVVKSGTLVLAAGATWKNAGTVRVVGGTLEVGANCPFDSEGTRLEIAGEGVLSLPGSFVQVESAYVDGVKVDARCYSAANPGLFGGRLVGAGSLQVGKPGFMLIVR